MLLLLLLAFAAVSLNTIQANGQSKRDTNIANGITQQYRQNIVESIEKRLVNALNDLAAIQGILHQEQHVQISSLRAAQLRHELYLMKQVLFEKRKLLTVHPVEWLILSGGKVITGLAVMNNELYVGREDQSVIEVYDVATLNHRRNVSIPGLRCVWDMASCPQCDVVYISDSSNNKIYAVDIDGVLIFNWSTMGWPYGLSVNSQFNVIVTFPSIPILREVTPRGELIRNITLQPDIMYPYHAIQLDYDRYAVVHGEWESLRRVCIVNRNGTLIESYGGDPGSGVGQLDVPYRMLMFGGSLIVTDYVNKRLLLFNVSPLQYTRELFSTYSEGLRPYRMAISEDGTRFFVLYNLNHLKTFSVTWI